jgi:hypothetical protein
VSPLRLCFTPETSLPTASRVRVLVDDWLDPKACLFAAIKPQLRSCVWRIYMARGCRASDSQAGCQRAMLCVLFALDANLCMVAPFQSVAIVSASTASRVEATRPACRLRVCKTVP